MSIRKILTYPDEFLSVPTRPVKNIDGKLQNIIRDMADTMYGAPGVGLAAIQVGIGKSLLIYDAMEVENERRLHVLINPRIVEKEGEITSTGEGCLSVPDFQADVTRAKRILVEGLDQNEKPLRFEAEGITAIILQHEIDHLEGRLFIEHVSALKRAIYKKRRKKQLAQA